MPSINGDIVKEYLEQFKDSPSLSLARTIYKENKSVFTSVEQVRSIIRYYRGAMGEINKKGLTDRQFIREFKKDLFNPFNLPESDEKEYEPYIIPKAQNNILILSDVHLPYHSIEACSAAINYGIGHKINTVLLNGDIMDFHQLSQFVKDPRKRNFKEELETAHRFLDSLQNSFPSVKFYFKIGNHEERLETYLKVKAPELIGISEFRLDSLLEFGARGIECITDKRKIKLGKLTVLHGHELKGGIIAPVNPARGIFLRTNASTLAGHWHRTSHHVDPNINEDLIGCWSTGCLCELHPEWIPNNKWNQGAAIVTVKDEGEFSVNNFKIHKGKVL